MAGIKGASPKWERSQKRYNLYKPHGFRTNMMTFLSKVIASSPPFHTFLHAILARTSWGRSSTLGQGTLETGQQKDPRSREIS